MHRFIVKGISMPSYMIFPKFLMDKTGLSETSKLLYMILLNRTRISMMNDGWTDERGRVYVIFPIQNLAAALHKSQMTIKASLKALEEAKLIERVRQGTGIPSRIYVKLPADDGKASAEGTENCLPEDRKLSARGTENCLSHGQKTVCHEDRKLSTNNNKQSKKEDSKMRGVKEGCGHFRNVFLTEEEKEELRRDVPQLEVYIERLSNYMASTGKTYKNHAATIRTWSMRDNPETERHYDCEEGDSL